MTPQRLLQARLRQWAQESGCALEQAQGRQVPAQRIKTLIRNQETTLDLRGLHLTSLPACLAELTTMTVLDVKGNQLAALPALEQRTILARLE